MERTPLKSVKRVLDAGYIQDKVFIVKIATVRKEVQKRSSRIEKWMKKTRMRKETLSLITADVR